MSDAMPPVLTSEEDESQEDKAVAIEKSLSKFSKVFSNMSQQMIQKTQETGSNIAENVINNGLGPVSAALKPFESFFGFNSGKGIAGLFGKVGTGLFGTGEEYKGPINENKIRKIDPGAIYLSTSFKEALEESNQDGNFLSRFMRMLSGGGLIAAGLGFLLSGLTDDGPFKGLKKMVGKFLTRLGSRFMARILRPFRGFLDNLLKPLRGVLDDIWKRFKGLLDNVLKPFKGLLDNILKPFKSLFDNIARFAGKTFGRSALGGGLAKIFRPVINFVKGKIGKLAKGLKFVPGIGSIVSFGFAISRFKQGDTVGGILELIAGFADLVPGVGTAISWGFDILLAARDMGAFEDGGLIKANLKDVFAGIWQWVKRKGKALFGIIGSVMNTLFTGAIEWVGDKISGALELGRWAVSTAGDWTNRIFNTVIDWVSDKITGAVQAVSDLGDWVRDNMLTPLGTFFSNVWGGITNSWNSLSGWFDEKIWTPLGDFFNRIWQGIQNGYETVETFIREKLIWPLRDFFGSIGAFFTAFEGKNFREIVDMLAGQATGRDTIQESIDTRRDAQVRQIAYDANIGGLNVGAANIDDLLSQLKEAGIYAPGITRVEDAIIKTDGSIIRTHPNDTLIATQNPVARSTESNATSLNESISQTFQNMGNELANKLDQLAQVLSQSGNGGGGVVQQNNTYSSRFSPSAVMNDVSAEAF